MEEIESDAKQWKKSKCKWKGADEIEDAAVWCAENPHSFLNMHSSTYNHHLAHPACFGVGIFLKCCQCQISTSHILTHILREGVSLPSFLFQVLHRNSDPSEKFKCWLLASLVKVSQMTADIICFLFPCGPTWNWTLVSGALGILWCNFSCIRHCALRFFFVYYFLFFRLTAYLSLKKNRNYRKILKKGWNTAWLLHLLSFLNLLFSWSAR